jgi:hypothetical protein
MAQRSGTLRTSAPERAQIPESATAVAYNGWTGTQTIYLCPKKKKRKPHSKKEDTGESSDVNDGGWMREGGKVSHPTSKTTGEIPSRDLRGSSRGRRTSQWDG